LGNLFTSALDKIKANKAAKAATTAQAAEDDAFYTNLSGQGNSN